MAGPIRLNTITVNVPNTTEPQVQRDLLAAVVKLMDEFKGNQLSVRSEGIPLAETVEG